MNLGPKTEFLAKKVPKVHSSDYFICQTTASLSSAKPASLTSAKPVAYAKATASLASSDEVLLLISMKGDLAPARVKKKCQQSRINS